MQPQHLYSPIGNKWICSISLHSIESDLKSFHSSVCYCSVFVLSRQYLSAYPHRHINTMIACASEGGTTSRNTKKKISLWLGRILSQKKKDDEENEEAWITYIYIENESECASFCDNRNWVARERCAVNTYYLAHILMCIVCACKKPNRQRKRQRRRQQNQIMSNMNFNW